ncbi:MAG: hypothetical protein GY770_13855 [Aestuariibacter sp.]|nr:hypothetical protein [Aestuariibacter sp.]
MLRSIFVGSKNEFNEVLVDWVSGVTDLQGVVWTKSTKWQTTLRGQYEFAKSRSRRYGLIKVIDETILYFFLHKFILAGFVS